MHELANCESNHKASDKNCPLYKFYREVNKVRTLSNIKYSEATDIVKNRYIFNQKVKDNAIENNSFNKIAKALNFNCALIHDLNSQQHSNLNLNKSIGHPSATSTLQEKQLNKTIREISNPGELE